MIDGGYGTIFTHPKDTFGQLQFQTGPPEVPVPDPRFDPGWARSPESVRHPMTLLRASHITTLVSDLDRAKSLYESSFGACTLFEGIDSIARRGFMFIGTETIVELAEPSDTDSRVARVICSANGQLPHSFCFLRRRSRRRRRGPEGGRRRSSGCRAGLAATRSSGNARGGHRTDRRPSTRRSSLRQSPATPRVSA